jgi:hypothetical protein
VFIPNVVPGDVIDVQTLKAQVLLWKAVHFHEYSEHRTRTYMSTLVFAVAVNGKIWNTANSCITKMKY